MLCARARPLLSSPFPLTLSAPKQSSRLRISLFSRSSLSNRTITMSSASQVIEHVVLFKVKKDTDPGKITSMVNGLNGLASLDQVVHLAAAPVYRGTSAAATDFTHILHSRYSSKDDLAAYSGHPDHVSVVKEFVVPICEEIMAVDWIADHVPETPALPPGYAARVTFLKLKEGVSDERKNEILGSIKGIKDLFSGIDHVTCGENFSPARAKGFSIASIGVFKELSGLELVDSQQASLELEKDKVRDYLERAIDVDYVVPSSSSQPSSL